MQTWCIRNNESSSSDSSDKESDFYDATDDPHDKYGETKPLP